MIEPFWLPGCQGALYALHYPPATGTPRAAVLCVSPFAEEMNKARRMQALQARQLAAAGFGVLIADPYGTGDSAGEFEAARWDDWRADLLTQVWLHDRGYGTVLPWGVRLGALLAMELAVELAAPRLLLWQPVSDGSQYLRQFLRLRLAAERLKGSSETWTACRPCWPPGKRRGGRLYAASATGSGPGAGTPAATDGRDAGGLVRAGR